MAAPLSINKMIQHKPAWTPEYSINMKIFKNALVLFIITIINIVSCTLLLEYIDQELLI
jgi:hypothetical protein